jgi:hypothetical protein
MMAPNCQLGAPNSIMAERTGIALKGSVASPARRRNDRRYGVNPEPVRSPDGHAINLLTVTGSPVGSSQPQCVDSVQLGAPNMSGVEGGR